MTIVSGPDVVQRSDVSYVGFRDRVPFRGLAAHTAAMRAEFATWVLAHSIVAVGPQFLRLHVIDPAGQATVTVAIPVADFDLASAAAAADVDPRVVAGVVPAGRYATLIYMNHGVKANLALTTWCSAQGLEIERLRDATGNTFVARLETLVTDPAHGSRAARPHVRLDFKLADEPGAL